ncbi:MAG: glycine cleavage system aminomethyltransferase GcvT [Chitinophagaceae bacterium]|jgi:aminomethyltransferase
MNKIKETALTEVHRKLGAKLAPFAGYNMPIQYEGINAEHETVRNSVGVFDVSHMGEFTIKGEHALSLIQSVTSNDASKLTDGKVQYSCLINKDGGIIDDLLVYRISITHYLLVVNASNIEKDFCWLKLQNSIGAELYNHSSSLSLLAVQGPLALSVLQQLTDINLSEIPYYTFAIGTIAGIPDIIISNTGYTGSGGFELYVPNGFVRQLWETIFAAGKANGIKPIGLGARDTLRLEMGYCLYGNDIDDTTSPLEAGLGWITKLNKVFMASNILLKQKTEGVTRKLIGFEMLEKSIPRNDYAIYNKHRERIGRVTSGTQSPTLKRAIGMGYVDIQFAREGTPVFIEIRNKMVPARICRFPFI